LGSECYSGQADPRGQGAENQPSPFVKMITLVREVEANLYAFYDERRGAFFGIFAVNMLAHLINVMEVCLILALMRLPASIAAGFVVEAMTKVINGAFFFVPTRAGVYESGNALTLKAIGLGANAGVALANLDQTHAALASLSAREGPLSRVRPAAEAIGPTARRPT